VRVSVWNEAGEEVGVLAEGMILEDDVNQFFFLDGESVLTDQVAQIAIVFPEEGGRGPVTLGWTGEGLDGEPLSNGAYIVKVESVDSLGLTTVVTGGASILRSGAVVTVRIYNEAGEAVYSRQLTAVSLNQSEVNIQGSVVDPALPPGSPGSSLNLVLGTLNLSWSGRDDSGRILANGAYLVEVTLESGGTTSVITETVTVLSSRQPTADGLLLIPNPVAGPGSVEIRPAAGGARGSAKVYTVSGELVRKMEFDGDSVIWDLKDASGAPVAAGLYLVVVESLSPDGVSARSLARLVVVR
jgi:flagellar hook assembly protein FlgD